MTRPWLHGRIPPHCVRFPFVPRRTVRTLLKALADTPGLQPAAASTLYEPSALEQFDPALAPGLKMYGSKGVTVQQWNAATGSAKVTLFQMIDSPAAYGVYTLQRSTLGGEATPTLLGAVELSPSKPTLLLAIQLHGQNRRADRDAKPDSSDPLAKHSGIFAETTGLRVPSCRPTLFRTRKSIS